MNLKPSSVLLSLCLQSLRTSSSRALSTFSPPIEMREPIPDTLARGMEATVLRYFQGVHTKNPEMIRSCFGTTATIRDVCGLNASERTVSADVLVQRCMEFVTAHPDCAINFHYGPECGRTTGWVVAHWYETGTWSGESCGIPPKNTPMAVEGQTRFRVDPNDLKIQEFVVTRTFTDWEHAFLREQQKQHEPEK